MTPYQFAIQNTKKYIRGEENQNAVVNGSQISAFQAAEVLAIAFMKDALDVFQDLVS